MKKRIAFVGGGNMATCLVGGLIAHGTMAASIVVADPLESQLDNPVDGLPQGRLVLLTNPLEPLEKGVVNSQVVRMEAS